MSKTAQLYIRHNDAILGPFGVRQLRAMAQKGDIGMETRVSPDGKKWLLATKVRGLFAGAVSDQHAAPEAIIPIPAARPEMRRILELVEGKRYGLALLFNGMVGITTLSVMFTTFVALYALLSFAIPSMHSVLVACMVWLPSLLFSAVCGHAAGNIFMKRYMGLEPSERRCLALHLPRSQAPGNWPAFLLNWIYCGDWLVENCDDELLPYVRAFITGNTPVSIDEELAIWYELMAELPIHVSRGMEVGFSVMELACLPKLPEWARTVSPGSSLADIESRLGVAARKWAQCLVRRAITKLPRMNEICQASRLSEISFDFHYTSLGEGREGLMVVIRPRLLGEHKHGLPDPTSAIAA
jgi:hypothetical protein